MHKCEDTVNFIKYVFDAEWLVANMENSLNLCHGQVKVDSIYLRPFYRFNAIRRFSVWLKGTCIAVSNVIYLRNMMKFSFTLCYLTIYSYLLPK